ncbi:hypothetical protein [Mesorhizobium marinum]|uniref:Lipoprotein n=1 Tax=Mesorhizobium marinum TaxID=3228790 RepID=A0ABV3R4T9_9HYPH
MLRLVALLSLLAVASCSSTQGGSNAAKPSTQGAGASVTLTDADRAAVEVAVRTRLADNAATFRTMIAQREANGSVVVCGYVNPGTGDTPFYGHLSGQSFTLADIGGPTERTIAVQQACHGRGIYI